jgi:hypothetical protein
VHYVHWLCCVCTLFLALELWCLFVECVGLLVVIKIRQGAAQRERRNARGVHHFTRPLPPACDSSSIVLQV